MRLPKFAFCRFLLGVLILGLSLPLFGGGVAKAELTKVRIGIAPYATCILWIPAHEFGIDKEFGLDFEISEFSMTLPATQAMIHGDIDVVVSCHSEHIAAINKAPQLQALMPTEFFKGFLFVGRREEWKSMDELVAEMGLEKARQTRRKQLKGKKWCGIPQREPLVTDTMAQVGLKPKREDLLKFADDQKAAVAFMRGTGDIYVGSLPQSMRMLGMPDRFINVGDSRILGPAGLWFSEANTTEKFIKENRETCLRFIAATFRTHRLWDEQREKVAKVAAKELSRMTGGEFTPEKLIEMQTVYADYLSIEECLAGYFNLHSREYWIHPVKYHIKMTVEIGELDKVIPPEKNFGLHEELFWELLKRRDLMELIYAPFPPE